MATAVRLVNRFQDLQDVDFASFGNGSLAYWDTSAGQVKPLVAGADGNVLRAAGASQTPVYGKVRISGATVDISGLLDTAYGGLGLTQGTSGGVLAFTSATALGSSGALTQNAIVVGGGAGVAPSSLASLGTTITLLHGNAAGAPTFSAVQLATDVSGRLPVANGGTGLTQGTSGGVLAYTASGVLASSAALTQSALVVGGGSGAVPSTLSSLGTTVSVLHGNASGLPTFGAVVLTTDVSGILPGANGGTGNGFFAVSGPASSLRTFIFPNASATVLTDNTAVTVPQGGTGLVIATANGVLYGNGANPIQVTAQGAANSVLTANAGAPSFSAAPTIGTSVTTPQLYGGAAAGSFMLLSGTSNGSPSSAYIALNPLKEGDVMVGTTTTSGDAFQVVYTKADTLGLYLSNTSTNVASAARLVMVSNAAAADIVLNASNADGSGQYGGAASDLLIINRGSAIKFRTGGFSSDSNTRATITSTGIGVGTTSPAAQAHLFGTGQTTASFDTAGNLGGVILLQDSGNALNNGGGVLFAASQGRFGLIKGLLASGSNNTTGHIVICNRAATTDSTLTERVRVTSAGAVGIALTTVDANYIFELPNSASQKAKANAWDTYSDARIKTNVQDVTNGLQKVLRMRPVTFTQHDTAINEDEELVFTGDSQDSVGFIAQDVQPIAPEVVNMGTTPEELWSISYHKITPLVVHGVQQLYKQMNDQDQGLQVSITQQGAQIATLQAQVAALQTAVNTIKGVLRLP